MEYVDGGILDPDDMLTDLVEDKDKVRNRGTSTQTLELDREAVSVLLWILSSVFVTSVFECSSITLLVYSSDLWWTSELSSLCEFVLFFSLL